MITDAAATDEAVHAAAGELLPELVAALKELVRIPSVATSGFPAEPVHAAHDAVVALLRDAGVTEIRDIVLPGKTGPVIVADVPGPPGTPTVLFYTHYDVVPAGDESAWHTPPFEPVELDGAVYGRGTADSKANIVGIIGALRVYGGRPPVNVRVVIEGQEEFGSPFDFYPPQDPDTFRSDVMVIADVGSVRPGVPTLTVALRGAATVTVECTTLHEDKHSGQFGGAAPDARIALLHALASLHDTNGDVAVAGLLREPWTGAQYRDSEFRELASVRDDMPLQGTGSIGERIWSGPAITVIAFDAPPTSAPINAVASSATAVLNLRVHPGQSAALAQQALMAHLRTLRPFGIPLTVTPGEVGDGFATETDGPVFAAATRALAAAWEQPVQTMATGGSIPLVTALDQAVPDAEKLLFGVTDGHANIHGPNERVLLDELRRAVIAKALLLRELAELSATTKKENSHG